MSFYFTQVFEIFDGKAGKERDLLSQVGVQVGSTGSLCAAGECPMPVVDLEF